MVKHPNTGRRMQWIMARPAPPWRPKHRPLRPLRMMTRAEWGALPPPGDDPGPRLDLPVQHLRYTFTGGDPCPDAEQCVPVVQRMQKDALERGDPDIMYNFLVGGDGVIFEARGWDYKCTGKDPWVDSTGESLSIAYIGTHDDQLVPVPMRKAGEHIKKWSLYHGLLTKRHELTPHLANGPCELESEEEGVEQADKEEDEPKEGEEEPKVEDEEITTKQDIDTTFEKTEGTYGQREFVEGAIKDVSVPNEEIIERDNADIRESKDKPADDDKDGGIGKVDYKDDASDVNEDLDDESEDKSASGEDGVVDSDVVDDDGDVTDDVDDDDVGDDGDDDDDDEDDDDEDGKDSDDIGSGDDDDDDDMEFDSDSESIDDDVDVEDEGNDDEGVDAEEEVEDQD